MSFLYMWSALFTTAINDCYILTSVYNVQNDMIGVSGGLSITVTTVMLSCGIGAIDIITVSASEQVQWFRVKYKV